jgi:hypothetical protein
MLNEGWAQLDKVLAWKLKWAGHQGMMAWATKKSPKAAVSICRMHEILQEEINKGCSGMQEVRLAPNRSVGARGQGEC